ncbi:DUF58 domain-containing protein, partial [Chloroflexota bacterium]
TGFVGGSHFCCLERAGGDSHSLGPGTGCRWPGQIMESVLTGQRFLSEQRVFPGEHIELRLRLVNRKILPLPWVQVDDEIPDQLAPPDATLPPGSRPGFSLLSNAASLLWYTGVSWRYRLFCRKRGYYPLGSIAVSSGDIFGFYPRSMTQPLINEVIVYPSLFPIHQLGIPSLYPLGETQAERRIFEDPTRTIGVRDYSPHDSLRHVHWKASARHQKLQVKVFEPTTTLKVALFLAVDSFTGDGVSSDDDFELGVSTAASVANYAVQQRSSVGLFANTCLPDSGQPIRILPGGGLHQLVGILEALAKVVSVPSISFGEFFQEEWGCLPWGTTLILVISRPPEALVAMLIGLREAGYKVLVLQIGGQGRNGADRAVAWHNVRSPGDLNAPGSGGSG